MPREMLTSGETNSILRELSELSGITKKDLARIAAVVSLKESGRRDFSDVIHDKAGGFRLHMSLIDPEGILSAFVASLYQIDYNTDKCLELICNHINEGAQTIHKLYKNNGDINMAFVELESRLTSFLSSPFIASVNASESMEILVGHLEGRKEQPFYWKLNDSRANPHTAILGETRSGKTQLLLDILAQLREKTSGRSNFIFLAYRKDDSLDEFAENLGIEILNPDKAPLPINPFILSDYSEREIRKSAQEKCDLMAAFDRSIRNKQKSYLRNAIIQSYEARRGKSVPYPDFDEVRENVLSEYGDARDTLTEMLDSFVNLSLFERADPTSTSRRFLSSSSAIVKLEGVPEKHRAIVASLILASFASECSTLPRAEIDADSGTRAIRSCIVIDEAHNYLHVKNYFLEKLLRESADSGFIVMLATQTPKSLCASQDIRELIGTFFVFHCRVSWVEAQILTSCKGSSRSQISEQIQNLPTGHCIVNHSQSTNVPYSEIEASQYFQRIRGLGSGV